MLRAAAALVALLAPVAFAHDGGTPRAVETGVAVPMAFPVQVEPRFSLVDHNGRRVTEADFAGRPMLVFFGYANCEGVCPLALATIAEALDLTGEAAAALVPVLVTVDPARDSPAALGRALARHHPRLVGLTGSAEELAAVRAAFQVDLAIAAETPGGPVYAHGSFVYLFGPDARLLALIPPVLGAGQMARLIDRNLYPPPPLEPAPGE